jgi:uncharacterized protein (DUF885 family)
MLDRRSMLAGSAGLAALAFAGGPAAAQTVSEMQDGQLDILLKKQFDKEVATHPERATSLGLDKGPLAKLRTKLNDYSLEGAAKERDDTIDRLNVLKNVTRDSLSNHGALSYDIALFRLELAQETEHRFPYGQMGGRMAPYVLSQLTGAYYTVPDFLSNEHKIDTKEDADSYLARLRDFAGALDAQTTYFNHDIGQGVVPPDFIIALTIGNLKKLRDTPAAQSVLVRSVADRAKAKNLGDYEAQAAQIFTGQVAPALDRQIGALQAAAAHATHDAGVWHTPDGDNYYEMALLSSTTLKVTGDQIHDIGTKQVADIQAQMDVLLKAQGLTTGTVGERIAHLNSDPKYLYPNTDAGKTELIAYLNTLVGEMTPRLPKAFNTLPKAKLEIRRVPSYIEAGAPLGYYQGAPLDGSRPGAYYINLNDSGNWPKWGLPTLTYHEGIPGHHFQISLSREVADLPVYRRVAGFPAYNEGWALYAEQLAGEIGAYDNDPMGKIGMLQSLLFRACRLVADSGLHSKRWSREQAIKYLTDNCGRTVGAATNEVERYAAWPGQACSYKIGHSVISAMREKARKDLGGAFDLKGFHDAVLNGGSMPLSLLEKQVDAWSRRRAMGVAG